MYMSVSELTSLSSRVRNADLMRNDHLFNLFIYSAFNIDNLEMYSASHSVFQLHTKPLGEFLK